jgi:DNA polymerase type B, organellar and viral
MKPIYTLDLETDPFLHNRKPKPFSAGLYTGDAFHSTWHTQGGDKCIDEMQSILYGLPPGVVFIHNGGKFDMFHLYRWIMQGEPIMFINGRIVKCYVECRDGKHEFRDSFAIMPFALEKYKKTPIDYRWFERKVREKHKEKILTYLKDDCRYLHDLCVEFVYRFGLQLTVGGTAMRELRKLHTFESLSEDADKDIRSKFYYGGRVERFERGILKPSKGQKFQVYDINQSYPNAMKNFYHPTSAPYASGTKVTDETFFLTVRGHSNGCFPVRTKMGISFPVGYGEYHVTVHEFRTALDLGLFNLSEIVSTYEFSSWQTFDKFVDKFHGLRKESQEKNDDIGALFYKYVGNSAYGKFAQSPDNYYSYMLSSIDSDLSYKGYERSELIEFVDMVLWRIKSEDGARYNVATGASITGAARAVLMRGLAGAKRAVYCDTDSIICESLTGVEIDKHNIGAWKLEQIGDSIAIAGKKMYALYDKKKVVKFASKGVGVTEKEMREFAKRNKIEDESQAKSGLMGEKIGRVSRGEKVVFQRDAPSYRMLDGSVNFITRNVKST